MKLREGSLAALVPGHGVALHAAVTSGVVGPVLAALPLPVPELQRTDGRRSPVIHSTDSVARDVD